MSYRTIGSIAVLISILILPYLIYFPILFIAIVIFPLYWEGILFALLIQVLYGNGIEALPSLVSPIALLALALIIILMPFRDRIRSYV